MHFIKWLYPGMRFKRWLSLFAVGVILGSLGIAIVFNYKYLGLIEESIFRFTYQVTGTYSYTATVIFGAVILVAGIIIMMLATKKIIRSVIGVLVPEGSDNLVDLIFQKRKLNRGPAIVVIGGGTGLSVLLRGLKSVTSNITAIVTVADDGGSSGRLREDFNIIPPGDLRNCLVALADTEPLMEKLFQHRFGGAGGLAGHSFGNLFIAAMTEILGDVELALKESSKVLAVRGRVLPASTQHIRLSAEMMDGTIVEGESRIPQAGKPIRRVFINPADAEPVQTAIEAIQEAELVVIGPGSLYTSVLPNLLVKGIADALRASDALKVYVCNVMTQPGETDGYSASQHVAAVLNHVGEGVIDYALVNDQKIDPQLQAQYAEKGAYPVAADVEAIEALGVRAVKRRIISEVNVIRHDPLRLSRAILTMSYDHKPHAERVRFLDYYLLAEQKKSGGKAGE